MALTTITRLSLRSFQLWSLLGLWILLSSCLVYEVSAQTVVNGQTYTDGLAILNSPAMGSTITIGSIMNISVDVGQVSSDFSDTVTNSTATTRITYLSAYLISERQATNITVIQGSSFLADQQGSSVKQASFSVPSCASPGSYNLTIYEGSVINGTDYFAITPVPVRITTSRPGGVPCSTLFNNILQLPQEASPPPVQPWISERVKHSSSASSYSGSASTSNASTSGTSTASAATTSVGVTTTVNTSGANTSGTSGVDSSTSNTSTSDASTSDAATSDSSTASASSDEPITITKTIDGKTATVTVSAKPSTITKVFSSVRTRVTTLTESGTTEVLTTTVETLSTSTKVVESAPSNPPGFFPVVDSAASHSSSISIAVVCGIFPLIYLLVI